MCKKHSLILIDSKNKKAYDLTLLGENYRDAFGRECIIENINQINYELAFNLLQLVPVAEDGSNEFIQDIAYDILMLSKFKDIKGSENLYMEFASAFETAD